MRSGNLDINIGGDGGGVTLGETADTAHRGDQGKAAYDHALVTSGNPHGTTAAQVGAVTSADVSAVLAGYVPTSRAITVSAPLSGGGSLATSRNIGVTLATQAQAEAGTISTALMTPLATAQAISKQSITKLMVAAESFVSVSGIWTNPGPLARATARPVRVRMVGGGAGGGGGGFGGYSSGNGGAAGCVVEYWTTTADLPSTVPYVVGKGGYGGTNLLSPGPPTAGFPGSDTTFNGLTAKGGNVAADGGAASMTLYEASYLNGVFYNSNPGPAVGEAGIGQPQFLPTSGGGGQGSGVAMSGGSVGSAVIGITAGAAGGIGGAGTGGQGGGTVAGIGLGGGGGKKGNDNSDGGLGGDGGFGGGGGGGGGCAIVNQSGQGGKGGGGYLSIQVF